MGSSGRTVGAERVALTRLVQLAPVAPRWTPWSDSLGADRARRTDCSVLADLQTREEPVTSGPIP
jgi:hypothetical protein